MSDHRNAGRAWTPLSVVVSVVFAMVDAVRLNALR
jgi:hypothetical protein